MFKRIISLLLCVVMLTSVLASCCKNDSHNHQTNESTAEQQQGPTHDHTHDETKPSEGTTEEPGRHTHIHATAVRENLVDSTCTVTGSYDEVVYCSTCNEEISRTQKTVEKKAHEYDAKGICALCGAPECPVEKIEITNQGQKNSAEHGDYIVIRADENGDRKLQIEYLVYPNEASIKDVKFVWEKMEGVSVDENGLVTFTQSGAIKVKVVATDGSGVEDSLLILAI